MSEIITPHFMEVKDSNGNILNEGDSVTVIKDLKVKGSSSVIKRGTTVKNIRLTDDEKEIEGKVEKTVMVLKTEFLKKL
nr:zinc ribbon domain-containing protein YjdM [Flavobacterium sp. NRK1]